MSVDASALSPGRRKRMVITAIVLVAALGAAAGFFAPRSGRASSHREAPLTAADPQIDDTDVYAFVSPDKTSTVTLISNWIPFEEPGGGPNFYPWAPGVRYDINVDNDGDAKPDIIYRWVFAHHVRNPNSFLFNSGPVTSLTDTDLNQYDTYTLKEIEVGGETTTLTSNGISVPSDAGKASMPDYAALLSQGIRHDGDDTSFAGQVDDPFALDLRIFDLLYGGDFSEAGFDTLAGFNVNSTAIQVPKSELALNGDATDNPVIGVWSTASRRSTRIQSKDGGSKYEGKYVQVSRLGNPLVNEAVVPVGTKDYFNASKPKDDAQFLPAVVDPEAPHVVNAVYHLPVPDSDPNTAGIQRDDLVEAFLTGVCTACPGPVDADLNSQLLNKDVNASKFSPSEELRLNMAVPVCEEGSCDAYSRLGVIGGDFAGFPNGRRLADDVVDIALQVLEGELLGNPTNLGDGVDANDVAFQTTFPYMALPHRGSDASPHL
jgi:hypothetical protein